MIVWTDIGKELDALSLLAGDGSHVRKLDWIPAVGDYYITDKGDVYSIRRCKSKCAIVKQEAKIRQNGAFSYTGFGNRPATYPIARAVYEAFIGDIKEGEKLVFADGDRSNFSVDNLRVVPSSVVNGLAPGALEDHLGDYEKDFTYVARKIHCRYDIDWDNSKDIAQESFLSAAAKYQDGRGEGIHFGRYWSKEACFHALLFLHRRSTHPTSKLEFDIPDAPFDISELPFIDAALSKIDRIIIRYTGYGYTPQELAKILHLTPGAVRSRKYLAIKKLAKEYGNQ